MIWLSINSRSDTLGPFAIYDWAISQPLEIFFGYDNRFPQNICICLLADGNVRSPFFIISGIV